MLVQRFKVEGGVKSESLEEKARKKEAEDHKLEEIVQRGLAFQTKSIQARICG